jgi:S-(hydroxymethyl)glutathione dehydrogenase/alcohol dehydrogenase
MKAAVLVETGAPLRVLDRIEAPAPGPGQVAVRLAFSGVCHSQVMEARGHRGPDKYLPHLLGHEGSGVVTGIGQGVTKVSPGDRVLLTWIKGFGLDAPGARYRHGDTMLNAGAVTTFNTHAVVAENRVVPLPAGVPMDLAVLFGCALPTGAGMVSHELDVPAGGTAAVFGLGGIGSAALLALAAMNLSRLIAVDVQPAKLALARDLGATDVIDAGAENPVAAIRALTGGAGVDRAVEAAGRADTIEQAFESVRRFGGLAVFASHPPAGARVSLDPFELICGKLLRGSWGGATRPDDDVPRWAALYRDGALKLEKLLGRRYALEDINDALDDLEAGRALRPIIVLDETLA